jgi:cytochrome b involved in lipid metabolism
MGLKDVTSAFHQIVTRGKSQIENTQKKFYLNPNLPAATQERMQDAYRNFPEPH